MNHCSKNAFVTSVQAQPNRPLSSRQRPKAAWRNLPSSPPTGGDFSPPSHSSGVTIQPVTIRKTSVFPDESPVFLTLSGKSAFSRTNLQHSHFGSQSKLQRQIAEGGIGSRKGKGPTKWEGPPAAICCCNIHSNLTCNQSIAPCNTNRKGV